MDTFFHPVDLRSFWEINLSHRVSWHSDVLAMTALVYYTNSNKSLSQPDDEAVFWDVSEVTFALFFHLGRIKKKLYNTKLIKNGKCIKREKIKMSKLFFMDHSVNLRTTWSKGASSPYGNNYCKPATTSYFGKHIVPYFLKTYWWHLLSIEKICLQLKVWE